MEIEERGIHKLTETSLTIYLKSGLVKDSTSVVHLLRFYFVVVAVNSYKY